MFKRTFAAGLLPALIVTGVLLVAFIAPAGAARLTASTSCGSYPYSFTSASLSASPAQPQHEGTGVTLTASSTGCPNPEYKFFLQPPGGSWTAVSGYQGSIFGWNTTNAKDGVWGIGVWVREIGSTVAYRAYYLGTYQIQANCTSVGLSAAPGQPQARGTSITLTGLATGCNTPRYRFWVLTRHGTHWSSFGPYSSSDHVVWHTAGYPKGPNRIGVWARQFNSGHAYDTYAIITFYLS